MKKIYIALLFLMIAVSTTKADTMKCNFFFKAVGPTAQIFARALFVNSNEYYEVDFSLADHNPYFKSGSALSWKSPFINDTFFQASVTPKVKKNRKSTVLNWTTSRLKIPTGHVTNLSFHVSIRTKVSNGQTSKNVIMDITAIGPNASVSTYGECN